MKAVMPSQCGIIDPVGPPYLFWIKILDSANITRPLASRPTIIDKPHFNRQDLTAMQARQVGHC